MVQVRKDAQDSPRPQLRMSENFTIGHDPLSLERIRNVLVRLEETIIFSLIERAQFAQNPRIYQRGAFTELTALGFPGSWLEWFLKETETFHGMWSSINKVDCAPLTVRNVKRRQDDTPGEILEPYVIPICRPYPFPR